MLRFCGSTITSLLTNKRSTSLDSDAAVLVVSFTNILKIPLDDVLKSLRRRHRVTLRARARNVRSKDPDEKGIWKICRKCE